MENTPHTDPENIPEENNDTEDTIESTATENDSASLSDQENVTHISEHDTQSEHGDTPSETESEIATLKDQLLRTLAENENIRKRAEKERNDTAKFAVSKFAKQLLSVADNLRRALDAIPEDKRAEDESLNTIFVGVEATERELLRAFEATGITQIEAQDHPFNPNFHEVMFEVDAPDKPSGIVLQILEPGYMIHDRLLRPARVSVSKGGPKPEDSTVDEQI